MHTRCISQNMTCSQTSACLVAKNEKRGLQDMRTADFESDGLVRNAFVGSGYAFSFLQDLLAHLIKVEEAFAWDQATSTLDMCSQCSSGMSSTCQHCLPGKWRNSPQSLPLVFDLTS